MSPLGIIDALDVIEHVGLGLDSRAVRLARRAFGLQRGEEALHRCIVPDVAARFKPDHDLPRLLPMGPGSRAEIHIRLRHLQLLEEQLGHLPIVAQSGVNQLYANDPF